METITEIAKKYIKESIQTKKAILEDEVLITKVIKVSMDCIDSLNNGGKIIFCGNGGSFADSQHLSAEFTSRFMFDRPALASIALGTNASSMSAIGNDYGYEDIFSRELEGIGSTKDLFIGITTSGNSPNVIKALEVAKTIGIKAYILTGQAAGKLSGFSGCINIPSNDTARIQESHILIGHIICGIVEDSIFKTFR
jgi:D-sedoheptulose 7-phosphate isomerase